MLSFRLFMISSAEIAKNYVTISELLIPHFPSLIN